jgi:hypothetical protein
MDLLPVKVCDNIITPAATIKRAFRQLFASFFRFFVSLGGEL